jgi:hypothetical protein
MAEGTKQTAKERASFARADRLKKEAAQQTTDQKRDTERKAETAKRESDRKAENQKGAEKRKAEQKREADQKTQQQKQDAAKLDAARQEQRKQEAQKRADERRAEAHVAAQFKQQQADQIAEHRRQTTRLRTQHREQSSSLKSREGEAIDRHWHDVRAIDQREAKALQEFDVKRRSLAGRATELVKGKAHFDGRREEMQKKFESDRLHKHRDLEALKERQFTAQQEQRIRQAKERLAMIHTHREARDQTQQQHDRGAPERRRPQRRDRARPQAGADEGKGPLHAVRLRPVMTPPAGAEKNFLRASCFPREFLVALAARNGGGDYAARTAGRNPPRLRSAPAQRRRPLALSRHDAQFRAWHLRAGVADFYRGEDSSRAVHTEPHDR